MKHILHTGNIIFGSKRDNEISFAPHISEVLEQWAKETNYESPLSELPILTLSTAELIYFDENEEHMGQSIDELVGLVTASTQNGTLIILTTYPSIDLKGRLGSQYQHLISDHFHTIDNRGKVSSI